MSGSEGQRTSSLGCLARLYWLLLGNVALGVSAIGVFQSRGAWLSARDILYWALVLSLLCVRYADVRYLGGATATGQPASVRDWRRYAVLVLAASAGLWALMHGLAYLAV